MLKIIFYKFPFLFFVAAAVIALNNLFQFWPTQVSIGSWLAVGIFIAIGVVCYIRRNREKSQGEQ